MPKRLLALSIGAASLCLLLNLPGFSLSDYLHTQLPIEASSAVLAETTQEYIPPPRSDRRIQRTEGGGSRGCSEAMPISLNLLTPSDHVPTTVAGRPTFLWYVSNVTPAPMRFTLVEPGAVEPILEKEIKVENPGIVQLQVPQDLPELVKGKEYLWTVSIICNERRPSENIYARAWIKRVPSTPNLVKKLAAVTEKRERGLIFAQTGIWYDAVSELYKAYTTNPEDRLTSKYFLGLLDQIGLTKITVQEVQRVSVSVPTKAR